MISDNALDFRTTNSLWASVLVETCVRSGVRRAVISPGSRSTPLTMAFARRPEVETTPILDERSAAFFALGLAKVSGLPVVLVCTSGTAAANYFPAIVEAHESGVPLLVITADRPPEMRGCASGQTIDQQKLYGGYVHFQHELALPALEVDRLRYLRQSVRHALERALAGTPGPVHLNAPFRDPLPPLDDGGLAQQFAATMEWPLFFAHLEPLGVENVVQHPPEAKTVADVLGAFASDTHGLIVVGPNQPVDADGFAAAVAAVANRLGWPVLADGLAPVRNYASRFGALVTTYDIILRNPSVAERLKPDVVLCFGDWPTSKVLRGWLDRADALTWMFTGRIDNRDALHGRTRTLQISPGDLATHLAPAAAPSGYAAMWTRYEQQARAALDDRLRGESVLVEPKVAWSLAHHLPVGTPLFIANSMPIRDVEYAWPPGDRGIRPSCNRGANGIDGTLSTALGVAQACGRPGVLLTGDLALLHDTNGFLTAAKANIPLTVVLINNRGGGIFEHLPVAQFDPPFETFFATPQNVDFAALCAAYGIEHVLIEEWVQFTSLIAASGDRCVRVLEIRTDRKRDAALRKRWFAEIAASL